jgi:hypothetical protein
MLTQFDPVYIIIYYFPKIQFKVIVPFFQMTIASIPWYSFWGSYSLYPSYMLNQI